jgi:polygalacturonase
MKPDYLTILLLLIVPFWGIGQDLFDVDDFGAKGDGVFMNTNAIQEAIDKCSQQGGGVVYINNGTYLSGSIYLKDNVTLHLEANAVLLGSPRAADYNDLGNFVDGLGHAKNKFFVGASEAKNISIVGEGVINGQGDSPEFRIHKDSRGDVRPTLIKFYNCEKVRMIGVTLRSSGAWVSHYFGCTDVLIQNVNIDSWSNGNNDGIDIDCCENVRIDNCNISSGDDAIVLKATANRPTRNVVVSNCILHTSTGAFKIGTESVGDIQNVTVSNCAVRGAGGGIKLLCMDGSIIRNINISNMVMQNVEMPIFLRLGSRLNIFHQGEKKKDTGSLENIKISNIQIDTNSPGRTKGHRLQHQSGIFITGIPGYPIKDISLENISLRIHGGGQKEDSFVEVPENISKYPEFNFFSDWLPAYGAYIRHAENVRVENISIKTIKPDQRFVVAVDNIKNFSFKNIQSDVTTGGESFFALKYAERGFISEHFPDKKMKSFISVQGKSTNNILLFNNDLDNINNHILFLDGASRKSVKVN